MANDPALQQLAQMLISKQRDAASQNRSVTVPATMPHLPAYQQPGQTMNMFAPMPSPAALMAQYQAGQKAQTPPVVPPVPPQAAPAVSPGAVPSSPPAADTTVPPMPVSQQVGPAPQQPSALSDVWASLMKMKGQDPNTPNPWATQFGNLADQTRA